MTFPACLRQILHGRVLKSPTPDGSILLREKGVMTVKVSGLGDEAVAVRLDQGLGSLSGIKEGPWKKQCDYVVVNPAGSTVCVLFVELKKTLTDSSDGFEQLQRSLPWLKYLRTLCRIECDAALGKSRVRYALIATRGQPRFDKQHVKPGGPTLTKSYKGLDITLRIVANSVGFSELWDQ